MLLTVPLTSARNLTAYVTGTLPESATTVGTAVARQNVTGADNADGDDAVSPIAGKDTSNSERDSTFRIGSPPKRQALLEMAHGSSASDGLASHLLIYLCSLNSLVIDMQATYSESCEQRPTALQLFL